ncbi:hypothetical protein [Salinicola tamaricis]|uniref:hypothetical protein n=1 Tax=Salinicola tamaricis TaxID=1771309 RepID=UPI001F5DA950|nr:hypothetical protein [Salinicola tamaricis]
MTAAQRGVIEGFVLTRHWQDAPAGTRVWLWLATDAGPRRVELPPQVSVAFVAREARDEVERLLRGEAEVTLRELDLRDFARRPLLGLYCRSHRQLMQLERRLGEAGIELFEADVRPPERYLMERFIPPRCSPAA